MFRTDNSSSASTMPTPGAVGPVPNGFYQDYNVDTGTPGTTVTADALNAIQEELCNIVTAADITLSKTEQNQVLTAINSLISAAIIANRFAWSLITASQSLSPQMGVVTNSGADTLALTLPTTCNVGQMLKVVRFNGNFTINQNASQIIYYGALSTTAGVDGYITPTGNNASVDLLCVVANLQFVVVNSQGSFEVF